MRELDRETARVLGTVDVEGAVLIQRRNGSVYTLSRSNEGILDWGEWMEEHRAWLKRAFPKQLTKKQTRIVDRLIAGE